MYPFPVPMKVWSQKIQEPFFFETFLGGLRYFIVTPHWMWTNVRRPLRFSSLLLLSEGTPRVPRQGIKSRTIKMAGRRANHWATPPHHPLSYASPLIELRLTTTLSYASPGILLSILSLIILLYNFHRFLGITNESEIPATISPLRIDQRNFSPCNNSVPARKPSQLAGREG